MFCGSRIILEHSNKNMIYKKSLVPWKAFHTPSPLFFVVVDPFPYKVTILYLENDTHQTEEPQFKRSAEQD